MDAKDIAEELLQETNVDAEEAPKDADDAQPEKMLSVSQVNELVKRAKRKGEQKMQEQLDAAKQQIEQLQAQQMQQPEQMQQQPAQGQQAPQGMTQEQLNQIMQMMQQKQQEEEAKRHQEKLQEEVNQVAQQYFGKIASGKEMFDDFDAVTADFDPAAFPQLVYLATQADNTAAIIYELQKNPAKLAQLSVLVDKSPAMARNEISKLSQSIKANQDAKNNLQEAQEPLNRMKPSPVGTDTGKLGLRDLKKASFLRG